MPPNTILQDDKCFSIYPPDCDKDAILEDGVCVMNKVCGKKFHYDFEIGKCVYNRGPECTSGYLFHDGKCVTFAEPNCTTQAVPGLTWDGSDCVSTPFCSNGEYNAKLGLCVWGEAKCEGNSTLEGDNCKSDSPPSCSFSEDEYRPDLKKCVSSKYFCHDEGYELDIYTNQCHHQQKPQCKDEGLFASYDQKHKTSRCCPIDTYWDGSINRCVKNGQHAQTKCDIGFIKSNGKCVILANTQPACPHGAKLMGDACVNMAGPTCEFQYDSLDGKCIERKNPICAKDFEFDASDGKCYHKKAVECKDGSALRYGYCALLNEVPRCPHNHVLDSKGCLSTEKPSCSPGSSFDGHNCVGSAVDKKAWCRDGSFVNGKCVLTDRAPSCTRGATIDKRGRCVALPTCGGKSGSKEVRRGDKCFVQVPGCDHDSFYDPQSKSCTCAQILKCEDGFKLNNGKCESIVPVEICTGNTFPKGGKCCERPLCEDGGVWNFEEQKCFLSEQPCPDGFLLYPGGKCVRLETPVCLGKGFEWDDDSRECRWTVPVECKKGDFDLITETCEGRNSCPRGFTPVDDCCLPEDKKIECLDVNLRDCDAPGTYKTRRRLIEAVLGREGLDKTHYAISPPYEFTVANNTNPHDYGSIAYPGPGRLDKAPPRELGSGETEPQEKAPKMVYQEQDPQVPISQDSAPQDPTPQDPAPKEPASQEPTSHEAAASEPTVGEHKPEIHESEPDYKDVYEDEEDEEDEDEEEARLRQAADHSGWDL
ncbi:hypothetical protein N7454_001639 [Penicillium verhagenii]|nr:hypothetical protein N7454_001639 [Penicillium verhagenii]